MGPSEEACELQISGSSVGPHWEETNTCLPALLLILVTCLCYWPEQDAEVAGTCTCLMFCSYDMTEQVSAQGGSKFHLVWFNPLSKPTYSNIIGFWF